VTWTACTPTNPVGWGNVLADYVGLGGALVIGTLAWSPGLEFEGDINLPGNSPFHVVDGSSFFARSFHENTATHDATHPIMQGVTLIATPFSDLVVPDPGDPDHAAATVVAYWDDGKPFVGINESCNIAGITLYPPRFWTDDGALLFFNAINTVFSRDCGEPDIIEFTIDIKPGSDPNSINVRGRGRGNIPVAILSTSVADGDAVDFDATTVDPLTVEFGPDEAGKAHPGQPLGHIEDVDGDGDLDLLLHFSTADTGLACGDTEATLTGQIRGSEEVIAGTDSVKIVPCR